MLSLLGWLHALLFRLLLLALGALLKLLLALLKLPLAGLRSLLVAALAMLNEEVKRWLGIVMAGLLILAVSWVTLKTMADIQLALLLVMLMGLLWLRAVFFAAHLTLDNRPWKARQRQGFRKLFGQVNQLGERLQTMRGEVVEGVAKRARGTVAEGAFGSNRAKRAEEQAAADAAAERAEREQAAATEWEQAVAAKRDERERFAAAARERWADQRRA